MESAVDAGLTGASTIAEAEARTRIPLAKLDAEGAADAIGAERLAAAVALGGWDAVRSPTATRPRQPTYRRGNRSRRLQRRMSDHLLTDSGR